MVELLTVHPSPSPRCRSNQPSHSSEDRALKMPTVYPPPSEDLPPSWKGKHSTSVALKVQVWEQQQHLGAC